MIQLKNFYINILTKKLVLLTISITLVFIVIHSIQAQSTKYTLWIDKFNKPTRISSLSGKWYSDGPGTSLTYLNDPLKKSQILKFSYSFISQTTDAVFASMICTIPLDKIQGKQIIGIIYDFKGAQHSLAYRTTSTMDFGFFQKKIPESQHWKTICISTADLKQPPWATKVIFNPIHIQSLAWQVWGNPKDTGSIYIDNVRFILGHEGLNKSNYFSKDSISEVVFSFRNYSLMNECEEYLTQYKKYYHNISAIDKCKQTGDSILHLFKNSNLSEEDLKQSVKIVSLSFNDIEGDTRIEANEASKKLIKKINEIVSMSIIDTLDKKYKIHLTNINFLNSWAIDLWNYATSNKVQYASKAISDSVFKNEITLYQFNKNDTIAEIGAGNGYFEQALSKYCDNLIVYVNEIDSTNIKKLSSNVTFLDLYDNKNIKYITLLGKEKTTNLPSKKFDKLIIKNSFHHFTCPNEMLQDFKRILKPNGKLFLSEIMIDEVNKPECNLFFTRKDFMKYFTENGYILVNETLLQYNNFRNFEFHLAP